MVYGKAKLRALRDYAGRRFPSWRLDYAFGNDYADRFLLSAATNPIAVCPSPRLRAVAEKDGWQSTIWR
jgi:phosphoserine phosphatase